MPAYGIRNGPLARRVQCHDLKALPQFRRNGLHYRFGTRHIVVRDHECFEKAPAHPDNGGCSAHTTGAYA